MALKGKCNCEAVHFVIHCDISEVYFCHCSICRKATGSNGIGVVVIDNSNFEWLSGQTNIKSWHKPDHDWQMNFCQNCGSPLPGENDQNTTYIPAGLLPDTECNLTVAHHIWVGSKASWDELGDHGIQHPKAFGTGTKNTNK